MSRCFACSCPIPYPLKEYQDIKIPDRLYCVICWIEIIGVIIMQDPKKAEEYLKEPGEVETLDGEFEAYSDIHDYFDCRCPRHLRHLLPYGDDDLQGYNDEDLVEDYY